MKFDFVCPSGFREDLLKWWTDDGRTPARWVYYKLIFKRAKTRLDVSHEKKYYYAYMYKQVEFEIYYKSWIL